MRGSDSAQRHTPRLGRSRTGEDKRNDPEQLLDILFGEDIGRTSFPKESASRKTDHVLGVLRSVVRVVHSSQVDADPRRIRGFTAGVGGRDFPARAAGRVDPRGPAVRHR